MNHPLEYFLITFNVISFTLLTTINVNRLTYKNIINICFHKNVYVLQNWVIFSYHINVIDFNISFRKIKFKI